MSINILETWDLHQCYLHPIPHSPGPLSLCFSLTLPSPVGLCGLFRPLIHLLSSCQPVWASCPRGTNQPPDPQHLWRSTSCACQVGIGQAPHRGRSAPDMQGWAWVPFPTCPSSLMSQPLFEGDALGQLSGGANFLNSKMYMFFFHISETNWVLHSL